MKASSRDSKCSVCFEENWVGIMYFLLFICPFNTAISYTPCSYIIAWLVPISSLDPEASQIADRQRQCGADRVHDLYEEQVQRYQGRDKPAAAATMVHTSVHW